MQNDQNQTSKTAKEEEILAEYKKKSDEIINQMIKVLMRAQKKVDNSTYRKLLEDLEKEKTK